MRSFTSTGLVDALPIADGNRTGTVSNSIDAAWTIEQRTVQIAAFARGQIAAFACRQVAAFWPNHRTHRAAESGLQMCSVQP